MHVCHGSLCSSCRARMLDHTLVSHGTPELSQWREVQVNIIQGLQQEHRQRSIRGVDKGSSPAIDDEERDILLSKLAHEAASASVKEQLHSRLLSNSSVRVGRVREASNRPHELYSKKNPKPDLGSKFSDSSDDEVTDDPGGGSGDSSRATAASYSNEARKTRGGRKQRGDDQEIFDLEI